MFSYQRGLGELPIDFDDALLDRRTGRVIEQSDRRRASLEVLEALVFQFAAFEDRRSDIRVDMGSSDLRQDGGSRILGAFNEVGEFALRQHDRSHELVVVQPNYFTDLGQGVFFVAADLKIW